MLFSLLSGISFAQEAGASVVPFLFTGAVTETNKEKSTIPKLTL